MSRYIDDFSEDIIIQVLRAYLRDGLSHRGIQKQILGLPAPAKGGGFVAMEILHHFDIKGEHKSLLTKELPGASLSPNIVTAIKKIEEFNALEELAISSIKNKDIKVFDQAKVTEVDRTTKQRVGQNVLRKIVHENYSGTCALCNIHQSDLLICSHIVPWSMDPENRLNPENAILLCRQHDGLFDKGDFTLDSKYNLVLSKKSDSVIAALLNGIEFKEPLMGKPNVNFLDQHRVAVCES